MPTLRYCVAQSLDGDIAGPIGEYDWIVADPEMDFIAMCAGFSGSRGSLESYARVRGSRPRRTRCNASSFRGQATSTTS